jgi:hypothetical protein
MLQSRFTTPAAGTLERALFLNFYHNGFVNTSIAHRHIKEQQLLCFLATV